MAEIVDLGPRSATADVRISYLLATVCGAALFTSSWALTFWICDSLLSELRCESLYFYLFVLLRDPRLQLLNFEIEHGLVAVFEVVLRNGFGLAQGSGLELALRNGYGQPCFHWHR